MTIDELGAKVQKKDPSSRGMTPKEAGERYLEAHPANWEFIDDGVVAQHLLNYKQSSNPEKGGLAAFFGKFGEKHRAEFFENRRQTAAAIVGLEHLSAEVHDIKLRQQVGIATAAQTIAAAKRAIHQMGIDAGLTEMAASHGMTLADFTAWQRSVKESELARQNADHSHGLQKDMMSHVTNLEIGKMAVEHEHAKEAATHAQKLSKDSASHQHVLNKDAKKQEHDLHTATLELQNKLNISYEQAKGQIEVEVTRAKSDIETAKVKILEEFRNTLRQQEIDKGCGFS
jgi:hypothetical protein